MHSCLPFVVNQSCATPSVTLLAAVLADYAALLMSAHLQQGSNQCPSNNTLLLQRLQLFSLPPTFGMYYDSRDVPA